jgi:IS30 family transposase
MDSRRRRGLLPEERTELWQRWRAGQSHSEIGRAIDKDAASVHGFIAAEGGFAPPPRRRAKRTLRHSERVEISRGLASGDSIRKIAAPICRAPSTVSSEVARHGGRFRYQAEAADRRAWRNAQGPKACRLVGSSRLGRVVSTKLRLEWSPEQISGWLKRVYPQLVDMQVSHETIYKSLFIQTRGALKKELVRHLRTRRTLRRSRHPTTRGQTRDQIIDAVSIRDRPAEVEDRAVPGHWEENPISGSRNTQIATLVERQSRFKILDKLDGKDTQTVVKALIKQVRRLPVHLMKTLTWDRGMELASHKTFPIATNVDVYFYDPQSPWQRGTNENTNRLLRQYFPKKTDLSPFSQSDLNRIALRLNQRPRKTLDLISPSEAFDRCVALTG